MSLFCLKILSRYPETLNNNKLYFQVPPIVSLRFCITAYIKPKSVRVKVNGKQIHEDMTNVNNINPENTKEAYYNIWLNLIDQPYLSGRITIECNYFGLYLPVKTITYVTIGDDYNSKFTNSDSYISPSLISNLDCQGTELEQSVISLPATTREASTQTVTKNIQSIVALRLDQLGDFVLTVSAFHELRTNYPSAKLDVIVSPANEKIAKSTGLFHEVITIPFSFVEKTNYRRLTDEAKTAIQNKLLNRHYNLAIDLSPMPETRELLDYIPADIKFGFENTISRMIDVGILIHAKDPINCLSNVSHSAYPLILVDAIKRVTQPKIHHIPLSNNNHNNILFDFGLQEGRYLVVHSGARNLLVRWPMEKFISLSKRLLESSYRIVFFSDEELTKYERTTLMESKEITIIDHRLDFDVFEIIIANAKLFIGNDSGPKHLAAMRGIPVVSVHSPRTNWSEWGQIDSGVILSRRIPCAGCSVTAEHQCAKNLLCISSISVDNVYEAAISAANM